MHKNSSKRQRPDASSAQKQQTMIGHNLGLFLAAILGGGGGGGGEVLLCILLALFRGFAYFLAVQAGSFATLFCSLHARTPARQHSWTGTWAADEKELNGGEPIRPVTRSPSQLWALEEGPSDMRADQENGRICTLIGRGRVNDSLIGSLHLDMWTGQVCVRTVQCASSPQRSPPTIINLPTLSLVHRPWLPVLLAGCYT